MSINQQRQKIPLLLALLFSATYSLLVAQTLRTESLTIADGLSQGMIYDIEQTDDGFLWFATKDGLNRYDGYNFKVFTNDPFNPFSIAGNDIELMFKDSRGNLWLGITGIGLDVLEKNSGKFLHLPFARWGIEGKNYWIEETPDGAICFSTLEKSLKIRWKEPFKLADNNAGLQAYTSSELAPALHQKLNPASEVKDSKGRNYLVEQGSSNFRIIADTQNEGNKKFDLIYETDARISCLNIDPADNLWVGTSGYGLRKIKLARQPFRHFLKGTSVGRICATDGVYLSFHGDARFNGKLDEATDRLLPVSELPQNISQMFRAKNGTLYVVGDDFYHNYLLVIKNGKVEKRRIDRLLSHAFTSIVEDLYGNIFATGGRGGLMRYEAATGNIGFADLSMPFGKNVSIFALHLDVQQNLWIGTSHGLARIQLTDLKFGESPMEISTEKFQIYQNDPTNPGSLRYNTVTSFCADPLEPERWLWVATKGGGLNLFDKTSGRFQHFTSQNSDLPNDVIYGILPDFTPLAGGQVGGNIWGSTNRGLFRLTVDSGRQTIGGGAQTPASPSSSVQRTTPVVNRSYRFRTFQASDGLQDDEFNTAAFARTPDGRLFFGGVNGLTAFYPSEIEDRQTDAPVRLTGLKINNMSVDYFQKGSTLDRPLHRTESIRLNYDQNLVTLEFALLDFQNPKENRFRYRLDGVDPDWVEAGTCHAANYAHLRPGHYMFEVQGSVSGGTWSAPASLRITVLPPWWATWWAYLGYSLLFCGVVFASFYFFKKRLLLQKELKQEHEESLRLKELDTFKSRLFTNLTHEFRTPLTVILGMAERLMVDGGRLTETRAIEALDLIKRNGKNLLRLINQLLDLSKLENNAFQLQLQQGDIVPYLRYVTESFQTYANSKNLSLRFFTNIESLVMDFDPEQIKQVMTNLISNAVKFTPSGGEIKVKLEIGNWEIGHPANFPISQFLISVTDTGIGISEKNLPHIFDRFYQVDGTTTRAGEGTGIGLAHTEELVKIMGGTIRVESEFGKGASFFVALPIHRKAALWDSKEVFQTLKDYLPGNPLPENPTESTAHPLPASSLPQLLIIEDSADVVIYLKSCLEGAYQIDVAYNGKIGIEKALENIPDLIISDVMMPEKDGYQVCDTLKNDERTSHIPIILLTAKADAASRMAGLRRGADAYVSKPFNLEELLLRLRALLDNQRRIAAHFSKAIENGMAPPLTDASLSEALEVEDAFVKKVNEVIEANYSDEDFALPQLCQKIGMSRSQLFRKMKAVTDTAPSDLIRSFRLNKAKTLLENGGVNVAEAAYQVGFKDPSYFSKLFQEEFGIQPSATNK